ncbi:MAG: dethiobiotin synthase [Proteobacteria bacterium]|nr:dethiobiotin synthase [Pseudomonadota bacterium]
MKVLILGIGTDIGKSFLVENLCRISSKITAIKPVCTGFENEDKNSDPARILTALGREISEKNLNEITPWRFAEGCSPHFVNEEIDFVAVKNFCQKKILESGDKTLLIEAAGGVMTPINNRKTFLDLAEELKIPVLLVAGNYLGAISHTLSAIEALKSRGVVVEKIIVNEREKSKHSIVETLKNFTGVETVTLEKFLLFSDSFK